MSGTVIGLWLGVAATLCVAVALLLWQAATARARRRAASEFVDRRLQRDAAAGVPDPRPKRALRPRTMLPGWDALLLGAGVFPDLRFYLLIAGPLLAGAVLLLLIGKPLSAAMWLLLYGVGVYFVLWTKRQRRYARMARQMPNFLDALVRLITIGNSIGAAFQSAVPSAEAPLKELLDRASQLTSAGRELDDALRQVGRLYDFVPLYMVAAVIGVGMRFGGRSDQVLDRMANFMRDIDQAREELLALSAETRLSAWILGLMPLAVAGFIVMFNNDMFMNMWNDPTGRNMLLGAVMLQSFGGLWLYRLAKAV